MKISIRDPLIGSGIGGGHKKRETRNQTHSVHQSVFQCRQLRAQSRWVEPSETCSTCWPDSSAHRHHSVRQRFTVVTVYPPQQKKSIQCLTNSCPDRLHWACCYWTSMSKDQLCDSAWPICTRGQPTSTTEIETQALGNDSLAGTRLTLHSPKDLHEWKKYILGLSLSAVT